MHCDVNEDFFENMFMGCPPYGASVIGIAIDLPVILRAIASDKKVWSTFSGFASSVMRTKRDAERAQQTILDSS